MGGGNSRGPWCHCQLLLVLNFLHHAAPVVDGPVRRLGRVSVSDGAGTDQVIGIIDWAGNDGSG